MYLYFESLVLHSWFKKGHVSVEFSSRLCTQCTMYILTACMFTILFLIADETQYSRHSLELNS